MKKWLKIWVVALAMVATVATLVSTGNVKAQEQEQETTTQNEVKVVIWSYNSGQNTCTWTDYIFQFTGSTEVQDATQFWSITCQFGKSAWQAVTLALGGDLVLSGDSSVVIPATGVLLTNGTWESTPDTIAGVEPADVDEAIFTWDGKTLYNKTGNAIGDANSQDIAIKVIVPAWQADGTYNGTLVLSYGG